MFIDKKVWRSISLLLPTAGMLILYTYVGTFSRLMGDDYCLLYFADRFGVLRSIWYWYLNWHGGFSTSFVDAFLITFGEDKMGWAVPISLFVWLGTVSFAFYTILNKNLGRIHRIFSAAALGSSLIIAILVWSPSIQQSLYWWSGLRGYVMPLIFTSLYPGLYLRFVQKDWRKWGTLLWYLVSFTLFFFVGGFSETFNPGLLAAILFVIVMKLTLNKFDFRDRTFLFLLFGFVGLVIAFAVMILAPGNSARQNFFSKLIDPFTVLKIASLSYFEFLSFIPNSWILSSVFLGVIFGSLNLGMGEMRNDPPQRWVIGLVLAATFVIPWVCFVPFAYVAGEPLVPRAMIDPAFLFTAFLMYWALLTGRLLSSKIKFENHLPFQGLLAVLVFVLLSISLWQAGQDFYTLSQAHIKYAQEWDRTQIEINRAVQEGRESLLVPQKNNWAGVLELNDNPKFYVNRCISRYYKVDIRTDDSLSFPE